MYCEICGKPLYEIDDFMISDSKHYCLDCVDEFDIDEILRVCGICDIYELLTELGCKFEKI